ncbi:MAG: type II toxin-antitoxin system RatA family toxin [Candidatus Accumulibacter sp.]|uniref:Type II toxin-antitoxin system RatA family toxin n=2 Tax=Candidatus Accumulibacter affinis TaxID=2954384 RepID=A0A935T6K2_9PROT|nr:type II toxin-antitoxin system RatA family toxin [Candidatus Accumulibacter affinis]
MATHRERRAIALPPEWLFDIVADVERYPEFVPLIRDATIVNRYQDAYETEQSLALGRLMHRFRTRTELVRPRGIRVTSDDRSFCRFDVRWTFSALGDDHCHVDFALDCTSRSLFLFPVVEMLVLPMAASMVTAFETRAHALAARAGVGKAPALDASPDAEVPAGGARP